MAYDALREKLIDGPDATLAAFPDGSVDTRYTVRHGEEVIATRRRLGEVIAGGEFDSFRLEGREMRPGGQAPNAAVQAHALGADVRLAGHLDAGALSRFPFPTYSMGTPATVTVFELDGGDVMFAEESHNITDWTLADLLDAVPEGFFDADAAFGANWVSFPGMTDALEALPEHLNADTFCFDPGNCTGYDRRELRALLDALGGFEAETVLTANRAEVRALAGAVGAEAGDDAGRLREIRRETGCTVVLHAATEALAATPEGPIRVPNLDVGTPVRQSGAGDRFGGGLAVARGAGWDWESAIACGNACASRYVATGETGDAAALRSFLAGSAVA